MHQALLDLLALCFQKTFVISFRDDTTNNRRRWPRQSCLRQSKQHFAIFDTVCSYSPLLDKGWAIAFFLFKDVELLQLPELRGEEQLENDLH